MDEPLLEVGARDSLSSTAEPKLDPRRVRSFIGLSLGRLGPRAFGAVAGIFLALLVAERTDSLLMVTFALTAHRIVTWIAFPLAGRMSDRSHLSIGRRVPYMGGGLIVAGVCTALFTHARQLLGARRPAHDHASRDGGVHAPVRGDHARGVRTSRWVRAGVAVASSAGSSGSRSGSPRSRRGTRTTRRRGRRRTTCRPPTSSSRASRSSCSSVRYRRRRSS